MFADPHTPVVLAGPLVQSVGPQQPEVGMHSVVPGQFLNPELQTMLHLPLVALQAADPFDAGVGHDVQVEPQKLVLVSDWQMPLQLCEPVGQTPLQAFAVGMQAPAHSLVVLVQAGTHASPSQVTVPPVGAWHAVHDVVSFGPQVATALLLTHLPPQRWKPELHCSAHAPLTQAAAPLVSVGQLTQLVPHPVGSLSAAQRVLVPAPQT